MMDGEVHITGLELINRCHDQPNVLIGYALPGRRARQGIIDIHFPTFSGLEISGRLGQIRAVRVLHEWGPSRWIGTFNESLPPMPLSTDL